MTSLIKKEFLETILKKHYNDPKIIIDEYKLTPAVNKGDNYISIIWRANIDWRGTQNEPREENLIIKTIPENALLKNANLTFFKMENIFYKCILPIYMDIYKKRTSCKRFPKLTTVVYPCQDDDVVILKDLAQSGFRLCNRQKGADFNHGVLILGSLAQLHALSIAACREKGNDFKKLVPDSFYHEKNEQLIYMFFIKVMNEVVGSMEHMAEFKKYIPRILLKTPQDIIDILRKGSLKVLCHGDAWINNMLFRYDEDSGVPIEIRLIDFQISYFGSLACDLTYFLYTSMKPEVLSTRKQELIEIYICALHKHLKELDEKVGEFTRENIYKDLKEVQYFGVILVCSLLGMLLTNPEDALDLSKNEDFEKISSGLEKSRTNPIYFKKLLKHLENFEKENII